MPSKKTLKKRIRRLQAERELHKVTVLEYGTPTLPVQPLEEEVPYIPPEIPIAKLTYHNQIFLVQDHPTLVELQEANSTLQQRLLTYATLHTLLKQCRHEFPQLKLWSEFKEYLDLEGR